MFDEGPTQWPVEQHTLAKHQILINYLDAWAAILTRQGKRVGSKRPVTFIDAFAGPGIHTGGEPGSPVRSVEAILNRHDLPQPVHLYFIEYRADRHAELCRQLARYKFTAASAPSVVLHEPVHGDCNTVLSTMLSKHEPRTKPFGPALVFLDQFGYGSVPIELIRRILEHPQCEVLTYLEARRLNQFLTDPTKDNARRVAFGDDRWREAIDLPPGKRTARLKDLYRSSLTQLAGADWVWDFAMLGDRQDIVYWLYFCTNNVRGLEEMKKAMKKVSAEFAFCDGDDADQMMMFTQCDDEWLQNRLVKEFAGREVSVKNIRDFVLLRTPMISYALNMATLQRRGLVTPLGSAERISYVDDLERKVRFKERSLFE